MVHAMKRVTVATSLLALGVAFEMLSKLSAGLKAEIADWEDGRVFSLGVLPEGPAISVRKEGGRLRYLGKGHRDSTLKILFKNVDCAFFPLTGQMGADTAFVQHRAILHGNVHEAMQLARAMSIVQTYLLPGFILKRTFKRPPKLTPAQYLLKARVLATLGFALALNVGK